MLMTDDASTGNFYTPVEQYLASLYSDTGANSVSPSISTNGTVKSPPLSMLSNNSVIPPRPTAFSPMTPEEAAAIAAWDAMYGNQVNNNNTTQGTTTQTSTTSTGGIPPRPTFFSPMSPEEYQAVLDWDRKYGNLNTGGGNSVYTPPNSGGGGSGSGTNNGGGGSPYPSYPGVGGNKTPYYDYSFYRYGDGGKNLGEINQRFGTGNEWNAMKSGWQGIQNAWGKPSEM